MKSNYCDSRPRLRWGAIGAGGIAARRTIPESVASSPSVRFQAVMDVSADAARGVAERFAIPVHGDSVEALLEQDIDAVYIASPPHAHAGQVALAAAAGKHILCEKPIALSPLDAEGMEAAVQRAGVKFMSGFCMRYHVCHRKAREWVQSGKLGRPVMGRAQLTCWYPPIPGAWRQDRALSGGGALIDMGVHGLDLLEWILDSEIVEVAGFQDRLTHAYATAVEDSSSVLVRFANGAHGFVDNYFNLPDVTARNALELYGTAGSLIGRNTLGQDPTGSLVAIRQPVESGYAAAQTRDAAERPYRFRLKPQGIYAGMMESFSRCILENRPSPAPFLTGRHSMDVVTAIYRSVAERRTVRVGEA